MGTNGLGRAGVTVVGVVVVVVAVEEGTETVVVACGVVTL